jgi:aspartyl-tRNA(Asn)/glutamyl-tRNA(Gln) amidotransferase subunit A
MTLGAFVSGADLTQAMRLRRELSAAVSEMLWRYDVLVTASALSPAPRFDAVPAQTPASAPIQAMPWNVTGHPALAVPTGFSPQGLPLGMQIVGRFFDEAGVLGVGAAYEAATAHKARRPPLAA